MADQKSRMQVGAMNKNVDSPSVAFLSLTQINSLLDQDVDEVQSKFEEILNFKECRTNLKEATIVDYFVSGFRWGKERNFTSQQLSGFMELLQKLLDNLATKHMTLEENLIELSSALTGIGRSHLNRNESLRLFSIEQAKHIIDYFKTSLFQHYKLYEYMFSFPRDEMVITAEQTIEGVEPVDTPFPAPLEEGIAADLYSEHTAPPPILLQDQEESKTEINEMLKVQEEAYSAKIEILEKP